MPESENYKPVLPKFKDKVMYIPASLSKTKIETSYVIASSFKSILRLSPNNFNSIYEKNPLELTNKDDESLSTTYSDSIKFDEDAIIPSKTNADITQRMIVGSDSEGYLLNFRMSEKDVEFDNLNVIGTLKTKRISILSDDWGSKKEALSIGNTVLPTISNNDNPSGVYVNFPTDLENEFVSNGKLLGTNYDVREVNVKEKGDRSYILCGSIGKDGKRVFSYKNTRKFIHDLIMEALLDVQSVPTGSIQWLPVTFEQYCKLGLENGNKPNTYWTGNKDENGNDIPVDPIFRDYLICDGRQYWNKDFPELAKILWKEKIYYWKEKNGVCVKTTDAEITNDYANWENSCFRVPDLRTKFLSYCQTKGALSYNDSPIISDVEYKSYSSPNLTGYYTPDNKPKNGTEENTDDNHFHFIAYGTYGFKNQTQNLNFGKYGIRKVAKGDGESADKDSKTLTINKEKPAIWYLHNHPGWRDRGGIDQCHCGFGFSRDRRRSTSSTECIGAIAFASIPYVGDNAFKGSITYSTASPDLTKGRMVFDETKITVGLSSKSFPSVEMSNITNQSAYGCDENNILNNEKYNDYDDHIHGYENTPKYYAMIPLIKI